MFLLDLEQSICLLGLQHLGVVAQQWSKTLARLRPKNRALQRLLTLAGRPAAVCDLVQLISWVNKFFYAATQLLLLVATTVP
jgi:hypothetical protein